MLVRLMERERRTASSLIEELIRGASIEFRADLDAPVEEH